MQVLNIIINDKNYYEAIILIFVSKDVCVRMGLYESAKKYVGWPITPGFEFSGKQLTIN